MLSGLTNGRQINCLRTKTSIGTKGAEEDGKGESERDVSSSRREKWRVQRGVDWASKECATGARARGRDDGVEKCGCARKVCRW